MSITFQRSLRLTPTPIAYKYYKWHITAIRDIGIQAYVQLSEFTFLLDSVDTDMSLVTISLLNGHTSPNGENAINLKDGNLVSKFLDYNFEDGGTEVLFEFPTAIIFNGYKWGTGNDSDWRDPKSWTLYGSNDNTNWDVLDTVNDFIATVDRSTFNTPFSYTPTNNIESKLTFTANPPIVPVKNGLTELTAGDSAYQIKTDFPASADGLYWISNPNIDGGTPFQIYADMTTDGGGWTLLVTNQNGADGQWTYQNAILRNQSTPVISGASYSIVAYADYLKKSGPTFQYMLEAETRGNWGGIWTAPQSYTFVKNDNTQTNITLDIKFGTWEYDGNGVEKIMPWYSDSSGLLTTSENAGGDWWGTIIAKNWGPVAPWMNSYGMGYPTIIWYWVR